MGPIQRVLADEKLQSFVGQEVYLHLETTNGAYAGNNPSGGMAVCAYIRNVKVKFSRASITGLGPYRAGMKMDGGWIYAEGLTDWEETPDGKLLFAGYDNEGRLAVSLEISKTPFRV
ncbi:DUF1806 family protein [Alicyclobacillus sp. TC]|uniref:DUF1806 domain-containing protein n=2 Tax=Alicyclobacillus tolerans TaxID=90970 RepID=A0ABT9LXK0_9BACL|nr:MULTISPECIES: YojF family protein [Alicyclobacillus]MDP9728995.1 hypothetical protein [Alicyclobacillus tengchongensis]QRF24119.1 DUF1806 family protein [Alicyclobacillus sp. TC]SHK77579.1 Protein of unknown function [Alicyclobacillus montanus]